MKPINQILTEYDVDSKRGFLPSEDPLTKLSSTFDEWEYLASNLTDYINAGIVRRKIDQLTLIKRPELNSKREQERAMLLLSFFAHAYIYAPTTSYKYIPESIAIPWVEVAQKLRRKPILSHSSVVLNNWRRLDMNGPIELNNLATLCQFHGGLDESWFYLVTVEIEQVGAIAIPLVLETMSSVDDGDLSRAAVLLEEVSGVLGLLVTSLKKVYDFCDPHTFYLRIRPFLASFDSVEYKGTRLPLQNHHGGSAAQSSLLQFFDASLGVVYERRSTFDYLQLMRRHMPYKHAAFLSYIESTSRIKEHVTKSRELEQAYQKCMAQLIEFRNEHLKIVALYVMKQAKQTDSDAVGTGGTNPMVFLKSVRNQNDTLLSHLMREEK